MFDGKERVWCFVLSSSSVHPVPMVIVGAGGEGAWGGGYRQDSSPVSGRRSGTPLTWLPSSTDNTKSVLFKAGHLSPLEVLQLWNKHITPLAIVEDTAAKADTKTGRTKAGKARLR